MTLPATAYIALGSNLGDRLARISEAAARIEGAAWCVGVVARSQLHACVAVPAGGPEFFNGVIAVTTTSAPADVLAELHAIEAAMGRVRVTRWEPRIIDLDLVAWVPQGFGCSVRRRGAIELPHPRAHLRDFVLGPLAELAPALRIGGRSVREHLDALSEGERTLVGIAHATW